MSEKLELAQQLQTISSEQRSKYTDLLVLRKLAAAPNQRMDKPVPDADLESKLSAAAKTEHVDESSRFAWTWTFSQPTYELTPAGNGAYDSAVSSVKTLSQAVRENGRENLVQTLEQNGSNVSDYLAAKLITEGRFDNDAITVFENMDNLSSYAVDSVATPSSTYGKRASRRRQRAGRVGGSSLSGYDDHDDFLLDFLLLDILSDGELDFDFAVECDAYEVDPHIDTPESWDNTSTVYVPEPEPVVESTVDSSSAYDSPFEDTTRSTYEPAPSAPSYDAGDYSGDSGSSDSGCGGGGGCGGGCGGD